MHRILGILVATLVWASASAAATQTIHGEWRCEKLIRVAEIEEGIPPGLLMAIGRAESGVDTSWGRLIWPWALNIAGRSVFAPTRQEAQRIAAESLTADPKRFIDLGCLQINFQYHREWLRDHATALDPNWNVAYGARLLRNLAAQHGSWEKAVGFYHSANPLRQASYLANVARNYCDGSKTSALCQSRPPALANAPVKRVAVRIYRVNTKDSGTVPGAGAPPKMILLR